MWFFSDDADRVHAPGRGPERRFPCVTAHAGSLETPPNTRSSFEAALAHPVDFLEADVRFTDARMPYLAHDALPTREQADAMTLAELLALAAAHRSVGLNLDMKELSGLREMAALVRDAGMRSRVLLTGITRHAVPAVRDGAPDLPYMLNALPGPVQRFTVPGAAALCRLIRDCGARGLNVHHGALSGCLAHALSVAGLAISVWTVDSTREMRRMLRLAVDNITTRRVDRLLALREEAA
jgi:glycerophosphoryl diester phosphodiesterase